jgi:hypothetical protein
LVNVEPSARRSPVLKRTRGVRVFASTGELLFAVLIFSYQLPAELSLQFSRTSNLTANSEQGTAREPRHRARLRQAFGAVGRSFARGGNRQCYDRGA